MLIAFCMDTQATLAVYRYGIIARDIIGVDLCTMLLLLLSPGCRRGIVVLQI